jgi:hypothetical protein
LRQGLIRLAAEWKRRLVVFLTGHDSPSMHPYLEEARDQIAEQYRSQLAACDRIRDHAIALIENWTGRPLDPEKGEEAILAAIFARSLNTYWAAIELTRIGFGEQAAMLNRSLFEDMVDAHWVSTEPELAVERYEQHHEHSKMLLADAVTAYPNYFPSDKIPEFTTEERKALDGVFGRYGAGSWTGLNLHEKVAAIEHLWGDKRNRETLRFFRDIAHRENNQMLHLSAQSLGQVVHARGPEGITFQLGPGGDFIDRALFGSFWIFIQTLTLLLDQFEFKRDRDAEADLFSDAPFRKPTAPA